MSLNRSLTAKFFVVIFLGLPAPLLIFDEDRMNYHQTCPFYVAYLSSWLVGGVSGVWIPLPLLLASYTLQRSFQGFGYPMSVQLVRLQANGWRNARLCIGSDRRLLFLEWFVRTQKMPIG